MVSPGGGRRELESGRTNILPPGRTHFKTHMSRVSQVDTVFRPEKGGTQLNLRQEEFFFFFSFSFFFFFFLFLSSFSFFFFFFSFSFFLFLFLFLLIINDTNINDINI